MTAYQSPADDTLRQLLTTARTIAVIGHSDRPDRPSYQIAQFLRRVGYRVYPINPAITTIDGEPCYPSLSEVPEPIDIVNVFRRSEYLPAAVDEAIGAGAKSVWAQLRIRHPDAAASAEAAGILLVMDLCIKIEHRRLAIPSMLQ
ncbi:MAG: CoA-binding protein [Cyanobacteria bacterium Co-bin13]|nr:CoA-binding protein [Cyanobacteria bacterium Co-bin13]